MSESPVTTIITRHKRTRTRLENVRIRMALVLTTGIPLLLTFLVPLNRLILFECPFLNITGFPGPFCGFTRSMRAISAGDWSYATVNCPLAWPLYALLVIVFAWNAGCIVLGNKTTRPFMEGWTRARANQAVGISIILILLNWIYRLSLGLR